MAGEIKPNEAQILRITQNPKKARNIVILLAASVALMMTGYGIIMPVMAKRLGEFGGGVEALGYMTMAFAVGQFLLSPFMGSFADRYGRKPLIIVALVGEVIANLLFLMTSSVELYVGIRFFQGAISAGLLPASMGVVADIAPEDKRAQWIGMVMGSYGLGFIFGPGFGGLLYDTLGFAAPFGVSAGLGVVALIFALIMLPETRPAAVRKAQAQAVVKSDKNRRETLVASLPRPLYLFGALLALDFMAIFVFAFIEPQLSFFIYNELKFSTTQFGIIVSGYGLAMAFGQMTLARYSDRFGRKPMIAIGFLVNAVFYFSLTIVTEFWLLFGLALLAGLGNALIIPALSAYYLDITAEQHRSRIMGIKESVAALGGAIGPLLVALVSKVTNAQGIFTISAVLVLVSIGLALTLLQSKARMTALKQEALPIAEVAPPELVEVSK